MYFRYVISLAFLLIFPVLLEAQSAEQMFKAARSAFTDELWPSSARQFSRFLKSYPDDSRADSAAYMAAVAFYNSEDYKACINILDSFAGLYPNSVWNQRTRYWLGLAHFESGNWELAAQAFEIQAQIREEKNYRERSLFYLGAVYERLSRWFDAASAYHNIVETGKSFELNARSLLRLGKMQIAMKEYEKALASFRNLAYKYSSSTTSTESNYWIGQTLSRMGRRKEALQSYQDFLGTVYSSPNRIPALLEAARLSLNFGKHEEALAYLDLREREVVSGNVKNEEKPIIRQAILKMRASSWLQTGRISQARQAYMELLALPLSTLERQSAHFNLAQTWVGTDKMSLAVPYLEKASNGPAAPVRADSLYLAASIESHLQRDGAPLFWSRFVSEFPYEKRREEVLKFLTAHWRKKKNGLKAIQYLNILLEDYPESQGRPDYLFIRGEEFLALGDSTSALRDYGEVVKNFQNSIQNAADSNSRIGFIYAGREQHIRAAAYYVEASKLLGGVEGGQKGRQALFSAAAAFANGGDSEQALKFFNLVIEDNPSTAWAVESAYYRAEVFLKMDMLEKARQSYQLAVRHGNRKWQFDSTYGIGWTWFQQGNWDKAAQYFNKAVELASSPSEASLATYRMALSLASNGKLEEALFLYENVLEMNVSEGRENTLYQKSWVLLNLGRMDDFDSTMVVLSQEFPQSELPADIYFRMGNKFLDEGKYDESILWFDRCRRYFEKSDLAVQAAFRAAQAAARKGNLPDSHQRYMEWVSRYPEHSSLGALVRSWATILRDMGIAASIQEALDVLNQIPASSNDALMAPMRLVWIAANITDSNYVSMLEDMVNDASLNTVDRNEALLLRADRYLEDAEYESAQQVYETLVRMVDGRIGALAQEGLARSFTNRNMVNRAADAYLALIYLYSSEKEIVLRARSEAIRLLKLAGREEEAQKLADDQSS